MFCGDFLSAAMAMEYEYDIARMNNIIRTEIATQKWNMNETGKE